jgi:murein DD-endopeptidase MepM/ murein hydrolase activator NlpD
MDPGRHRRRLAVALTGALGVLALLTAAPAAATEVRPALGWAWPLTPRPVVAAAFAAPAGRFAPGHRGVDLRAAVGARVLAVAPGTVAFAGRVAGRGVVSVDHEGGLRSTYEPVTPAVRRGALVRAGDRLGTLELFGSHCQPAACLHWGVRRGPDDYLDPLALLGARRVRLLPVLGTVARVTPPLAAETAAAGRAGRRDAGSDRSRVVVGLWAAAVGATAALSGRRRGPPPGR